LPLWLSLVFLAAGDKAKASEFKPILKQMYTLELAYAQEQDLYTTNTTAIGMEAPGNKARFSYGVAAATTTFVGTATLRTSSIRTFDGAATIGQDGTGGISGTISEIVNYSGVGQ
jgi:hypothetical protein